MQMAVSAVERLDRSLSEACHSVFPGCVAIVWRAGATCYAASYGITATHRAVPAYPVDSDIIYDLASLTKVLCTTTLAALAVSRGELTLSSPVPDPWSQACPGATLQDLLEHCSGLVAHREFFALTDRPAGRDEILHHVATTPLAYPRRTRVEYSDLGFMILGAWLEQVYACPLDVAFERGIAMPLGLDGTIGYRRRTSHPRVVHRLARIVPTEVYDVDLHPEGAPSWFAVRQAYAPWAQGEVHDDNAFVMDGVAGHAGLFGTAAAVLRIAQAWLDKGPLGLDAGVREVFCRRSTVPGSTRRCGWDAPSPDGSGSTADALSPLAFGHLGYTGTSLWIDPQPGAEQIYVLLSNRVHPTRDNRGIVELRRDFHRLASALASSPIG